MNGECKNARQQVETKCRAVAVVVVMVNAQKPVVRSLTI